MPLLAAAVALALAMIATLPGCAAFMTPSHSMHLLGRTQPGSFCKVCFSECVCATGAGASRGGCEGGGGGGAHANTFHVLGDVGE